MNALVSVKIPELSAPSVPSFSVFGEKVAFATVVKDHLFSSIVDRPWQTKDSLSPNKPRAERTASPAVAKFAMDSAHRVIIGEKTDEEKVFDARVELKVATAQYANHLSTAARSKLFSEFDFVLADDSWDPADTLPNAGSYRAFLKWVVFTKNTSWTSLGFDDAGNLLVAWAYGDGKVFTANFSMRVLWTQKVISPEGFETSCGEFSLEHFARQYNSFFISQVDETQTG